ncbi:MAG: UMP kinase [Desulfurococcales archaeon]|nr:UMP kinase [Desulfurococcales archaeon]
MARALVVKISGSLLYPPEPSYLKDLTNSLLELKVKHAVTLGVVVGGGPVARSYINTLKELGVDNAKLDILGIESARLNALMLATLLYPKSPLIVPRDIIEAASIAASGLIPVMGGLQPGQSTNAVSLALAEALGASKVINMLNNIEGVYDKPPETPGARLLREVSYRELREIINRYPQHPGKYTLLDHTAMKIAERSKITIHFIKGNEPGNLIKAFLGEEIGTVARP